MATDSMEAAVMDRQRILRITDIAQEPLETLLPIEGYEKMPLVPLEEAVESLVHLVPRIQTYVYVAKKKYKDRGDGLTHDESASIMLYTMGWEPSNECLYFVLNATLRSKDRQRLQPWFLYLRLLLNALFRLPSISQTVFRGVKLDLSHQYLMGETIEWWGFSSCTNTMNILQSEMFLGKTGVRTMFAIECHNGKNISKHSYFASEDEILLLPAIQLKINSTLDQGDLKIIHLQEVIPKFPLLHTIPSTSNNSTKTSLEQSIPASVTAATTPTNISPMKSDTKWKQNGLTIAGGNGQGDQLNQLSQPCGICVDDDDQCIYIADYANDRIVQWKFNASKGQIVAGGNGNGDQMNQLSSPTDVIIDKKTDSLIICDNRNKRIVRWSRHNDTKGETIASGIDCYGLALDNNGDLYVSDRKGHEVRRWKMGDVKGTVVAGGNKAGDYLHQLDTPSFLSLDRNNALYISDSTNHRVMKWAKGGKEGTVVAGGYDLRYHSTQMTHPKGVILDQLGNIYVADSNNHRITRWSKGSKEGQIIVGGNGNGQESNQLNYPTGLAFDRLGNLYVADLSNNRVQKFEIESN